MAGARGSAAQSPDAKPVAASLPSPSQTFKLGILLMKGKQRDAAERRPRVW